MVAEGRLKFPVQVLQELKRDSEAHRPDRAYVWASSVEATACASDASLEQVKAVLAVVPDVLDARSPRKSGPTPVEAIKCKDTRINIPSEELRDFVADEERAPKRMLCCPRAPCAVM